MAIARKGVCQNIDFLINDKHLKKNFWKTKLMGPFGSDHVTLAFTVSERWYCKNSLIS